MNTVVTRLLLTATAIVIVATCWADPGDEFWDDMHYIKGINDPGFAVAVARDGKIYVGGPFETADQKIAVSIGLWSDGAWHNLRDGLSNTVQTMVFGPGGHLFVGGGFSDAGGDPDADRVAVWNGVSWSSIGGPGSELSSTVKDLAFDASGNLYAVGSFSDAGGDPDADRIAVWDGSSWSSMGGPGSGLSNQAFTVAVSSSGDVVVGGSFTDAGGNAAADYIAEWNGSGWSALGGGLNESVLDLVFHDDGDLYVAGDFTDAGGIPDADHIAIWSSPSWQSVGGAGSGVNDSVHSILFDDGDLVIGGDFTDAGGDVNADRVARLTPTGWSALGGDRSGLGDTVYGLATTGPGEIVAVGSFIDAGTSIHADHAVRWDGTRWTPLSSFSLPVGGGLPGRVYDLELGFDGKLYVAGSFDDAGNVPAADNLAVWDGVEWAPVGDPIESFDNDVYAVAPGPSGLLAVGGDFSDAAGIDDADNFAMWDGASWSALGGPGNPFDSTVQALLWSPDGRLYVGGDFYQANGIPGADYVAIWDPSSSTWSAADGPGGSPYGYVHALALDSTGDLYAGGDFTEAGGDPDADYIAKWDGSAWTSIGGPGSELNSTVFAIAIDEVGRVYAGGEFSDAGGDPNADRIAMWDGSGWNALGSGLNGDVDDLVFDGAGNLYATGSFRPQTSQPDMPKSIAMWDGSSWHHLGSGLEDYGAALFYDGGSRVYVGGEFESAGDNASNSIACWTGATPAADPIFADNFESGDSSAWSAIHP